MEETVHSPLFADESGSEVHPLQAAARFFRAVRYRKGTVIVALVAAGLLGGLYYATVPREYRANGRIEVKPYISREPSSFNTMEVILETKRLEVISDEVLKRAMKRLPTEEIEELKGRPERKQLDTLRARLQAATPRRSTIIDISYRSRTAQAAALVVDAVIAAFLDFTGAETVRAAKISLKRATDWRDQLTAEIYRLQNVLTELDGQIINFPAADKSGQETNAEISKIMLLQPQLLAAETELARALWKKEHVEDVLRQGGSLKTLLTLVFDKAGSEVAQLLNQRSTTLGRLQGLRPVYGPQHSSIRELETQIQDLDRALRNQFGVDALGDDQALASQLADMARAKVREAEAIVNNFRQRYDDAMRNGLAQNKVRAQIVRTKCDLALKQDQLKRAGEDIEECAKTIAKGNSIDISQLASPEVPLTPSWPTISTVALLALGIGLGLGLALVYAQDLLDDHFRSPEELRVQVGVPVLALIRRLKAPADRGIDAVYVHARPDAVEVEAFRTLRTALALAENGARRLVVSSSEPGDGKTTVSANLAAVYAQSGKQTLVIDADMRRPGLTPLLGLKGQGGLSSVLRDQAPLAESLQTNLVPGLAENLDVLPAGPRPINPAELLASDRFSELLAWAEDHYDQIIIDSPPAMVADTAIIGRLVDGVLLTVQPEKNRRRVVIRAAEGFTGLGVNLLGVVINRLASEKADDYYGYGYGYGYGYSYGYGRGYGADEDAESPAAPPAGHEPSDPSDAPIVRRAA